MRTPNIAHEILRHYQCISFAQNHLRLCGVSAIRHRRSKRTVAFVLAACHKCETVKGNSLFKAVNTINSYLMEPKKNAHRYAHSIGRDRVQQPTEYTQYDRGEQHDRVLDPHRYFSSQFPYLTPYVHGRIGLLQIKMPRGNIRQGAKRSLKKLWKIRQKMM